MRNSLRKSSYLLNYLRNFNEIFRKTVSYDNIKIRKKPGLPPSLPSVGKTVLKKSQGEGGLIELVKPLQKVFGGNLFENPAKEKYGWAGTQKLTCMLLSDFRWFNDLVIWKDLPLLL